MRFILLLLPLLALALAAWLWGMLVSAQAVEGYGLYTFLYGLALALALVLAGLLAYLAWCANTIRYRLEKDTLVIRCGGNRHILPLGSIKRVLAPGEKIDGNAVRVRWHAGTNLVPGYLVGRGDSPQLGKMMALANGPATAMVFVVTEGVTFALTPRRSLAFAEELSAKAKVKAEQANRGREAAEGPRSEIPHTIHNRLLGWGAGLWSDWPARWLMLAGLATCLFFFAWMSLVYNNLPIILALHWNSQGQIDRVGDPQELLRLPAISLGIWFVNVLLAGFVRRYERAVTLFLLAATVAAPLVFAAGALSIILQAP